ncbi:MAG TPA: hypothetical protein VLB46_12830 [Pyrinomonadaceae bacterium]|nr:hypothetical protein [Pyrinomonadaceae bacterium]
MSGLLCLAFDDTKKCTVGVNRADLSHKWKLRIREGMSERVWSQDSHSTYREIQIKVTGGTTNAGTNGALVYKGGEVTSIPGEKRFNLETSWIDLEGARGHGQSVKNDSNTLYPRFYFNDGLFCASRLSAGLFDLKNTKATPDIVPLDNVALEAAADIFLDGTKGSKIEVIFPLPDKTVTLPYSTTTRYEIYISNNCETSCRPDEIDFGLHYGAFTGAFSGGVLSSTDRFNLVPRAGSPLVPGLGEPGVTGTTDRAPCMYIALGQTENFNP